MAVCYRHAQDVREHYERKLERANNLYMDLTACMLQLEIREQELIKYVTVTCRRFLKPHTILQLGHQALSASKHFSPGDSVDDPCISPALEYDY